MKLPLTLCAIDHAAHALTRLALQRCLQHLQFADVLILSDREILPGARHVRTQAGNILQATRLLWHELPKHIRTDQYLYMQWDSWIINPDAWSDEFLQYDYIGAPWPERYLWPEDCNKSYNVGNGGFSIRSMALAEAVLQSNLKFYSPEDHALCVDYRRMLQWRGLTWAPYAVAERFSAELDWPAFTPFGFHGAFHFAGVLTPDEYDTMVALASPYVQQAGGWKQFHQHLDLSRRGVPRPRRSLGPLKPGWKERLGYPHPIGD
jgi:hypothetical protein